MCDIPAQSGCINVSDYSLKQCVYGSSNFIREFIKYIRMQCIDKNVQYKQLYYDKGGFWSAAYIEFELVSNEFNVRKVCDYIGDVIRLNQ